jgi:hypothetical protein
MWQRTLFPNSPFGEREKTATEVVTAGGGRITPSNTGVVRSGSYDAPPAAASVNQGVSIFSGDEPYVLSICRDIN